MSNDYTKLLKLSSYIDLIENSDDIQEISDKVIKIAKDDFHYSHCFFLHNDNGRVILINTTQERYHKIANMLMKRFDNPDLVDVKSGNSLLEKSIRDQKIYFSNEFDKLFPIKLPAFVEKLVRKTLEKNTAIFVPCISDKVETLLLLVSSKSPDQEEIAILQILGKQIGYGMKNNVFLKEISQEKDNLQAILENAEYGICVYKDWQIHYTNPKFSEITGYSQEELKELNDIRKLLPPSVDDQVKEIVTDRVQGKPVPKHYHSKVLTKTGRVIDGEVRIIPIVYEKQEMFLVQFKDFTVSARVIEVLKNQSKYFAQIAHSLKTPFTVINGLIELELTKNVGSDERDLLNTIKSEVDEASEKVSQLLHIAKQNLTAREVQMRVCDMHDIIQSTYIKGKSLGYKYCKAGHNANCDCFKLTENTNAEVLIDPDAWMDALITIIENAYVHSPKKGEPAKIELSSHKKGNNLVVKLSDKGKGMPASLAKRVFNAENTFSVNLKGHGIGLPSSKRMVEQMNGKIDMKTVSGKGTTFTITLPLNRELK